MSFDKLYKCLTRNILDAVLQPFIYPSHTIAELLQLQHIMPTRYRQLDKKFLYMIVYMQTLTRRCSGYQAIKTINPLGSLL